METSDICPTDVPGGSTEKDATLAVKVALNIRPMIGLERVQGCKDCIAVTSGEPQVHLGSHSFTFDHVYGSTGSPPAFIFDKCVAPLVDGLFQGFNATVLAYGQTGSGKTYTMGTGYTVGGRTEGVIPKVMETIFAKMDTLRATSDFQIRVSFIEILREEVHDLLDPSPPSTVRSDLSIGTSFVESKYSGRAIVTGKPPIQIRETTNGGITLAGVTETDVVSLEEMSLCLEQGSLCRATGSTMMNTSSSRSHAIFTITLEQRRKLEGNLNKAISSMEDGVEDFLCAKFHLVDLAGSERAKRTQADGVRFKEGVHINRGLLALGNVISALGDDKKRRDGGHVPYRDSKLTRLLQDSLGGNSRTVMIACVSPADSNAEETLNTLKYANRARNIQNKPTVNRDPVAAEMSRMRQQLELMQAELLCARAGSAPEEVQLLKQKIVWLETSNMDLRHELQESRSSLQEVAQQALEARVLKEKLRSKLEKLRAGQAIGEVNDGDDTDSDDLFLKDHLTRIQEVEGQLPNVRSSRGSSRQRSALTSAMSSISGYTDISNDNLLPVEAGILVDTVAVVEEDQAKEWEHNMLQENLDKALQELDKRLELKEAEMKTFARSDTVVLKQHFERKLVELEEEKKVLQRERDMLVNELEKLTTATDEQSHKMQESYLLKLKDLESQIADLKKKQDNQSQHLRAKQRADEAAKRLQDDILKIKTQKVQLQQKIKQESEHFRSWKASREKELVQLRKEGRRNEYEMHKLQALHQRQKMVLQRKTEEASMATRRLKELLEARKSPRDSPAHGNGGSGQNNEKTLQHWLDQELEMAVRVHDVRSAYDKQMEERLALAKELTILKEEEELLKSSVDRTPSMSPGARSARVRLLETMLNSSSSGLVAMGSQLSEAEERERSCGGRGRWHHLRSMGDAKSLLHYSFDSLALSKCRLRDVEGENKEINEKLSEFEEILRHSEACRKELERQLQCRAQPGVSSLTTIDMVPADLGMKTEGDVRLRSSESRWDGSDQSERGSAKTSSLPYTLRKAVRDHPTNKKALHDEKSESSEGELDMDTESDEEWNEDSERHGIKRNRALGGLRLSKTLSRSVFLDRKLSNGSPQGLRNPERVSLGFQSSPGENVLEGNEDKGKERLNSCSCSCSQSSGCKTKKCECKAAGGLCGTQCGCTSFKCSNREAVALEKEQSISMASPVQVEVACQAVAPPGVDRALRRSHEENEANSSIKGSQSPIHIVTEEEHVAKRLERLLAVHGASLLESALQEEVPEADMKEDVVEKETGQDAEVEVASLRRSQRRPLEDIGNKVYGKKRPLAKQRKRQTAIIQLVPVGPLGSNRSGSAPVAPSVSAPTSGGGGGPTVAPPNVTLATVPDLASPHWRHNLQRRNGSGQLSPRLRDNKAGVSNSGTGASSDVPGGTKNNLKAPGSVGPASPSGPGRGTDGKENIQRNSFV